MNTARKLDYTTATVYLNEETYLLREVEALEKTEYIAGVLYPRWQMMAGGRILHNAISVNVSSALNVALRGKGCRTLSSDQRVVNPLSSAYLYPDVSVVCGKADIRKYDCLANPTLVVEVTSPSSVEYDRTTKLLIYAALPSVQEYMIVSHTAQEIMLFRRNSEGALAFVEIARERVEFTSVGCMLSITDIYDGVELEELREDENE